MDAILPAISVGLTLAVIVFLTFNGRVRRNV
jgi:hypothetical protein